MTAYFIRRFLLIIPTFLGITIMVFIVTRFVPGGPIELIIAEAQQMQSMEGSRTSGSSSAEQSQPLSAEQIERARRRCHSHGGALVGRAKRK
jgi:microcin C transport system permease protein